MNASTRSSGGTKANRRHDADAWSGWGCLIGAILGLTIGLGFGRPVVLGFASGAVGWLVGALVDRSRR